MARDLLADGAQVVAYDPVAGDQAAHLVPGLELADKAVEVADGAHAVVLMTEWAEFGDLDPAELRARMAYPILVDARNALDAEAFVAGRVHRDRGRPPGPQRPHPGLALSLAVCSRSQAALMAAG